MIVREISVFPVVHYKQAVNSTKAVIDRQHLIKFILSLLCQQEREEMLLVILKDIFPRTYNTSSGISEYI